MHMTARAARPRPEWSIETEAHAVAIVGRVIERNGKLFRRYPEYDSVDLESECMLAVRRGYARWNSAKCAFNTFAYRAARNRMVDLFRRRHREAKREGKVIKSKVDYVYDPDPQDHAALVDWLSETYREICGIIRLAKPSGPPARGPGGRPKAFTAHQACAIMALQRRMNLSTRGVEMVLKQRADLRDAIGLGRVPDHSTVSREKESVAKLKKSFEQSIVAAR